MKRLRVLGAWAGLLLALCAVQIAAAQPVVRAPKGTSIDAVAICYGDKDATATCTSVSNPQPVKDGTIVQFAGAGIRPTAAQDATPLSNSAGTGNMMPASTWSAATCTTACAFTLTSTSHKLIIASQYYRSIDLDVTVSSGTATLTVSGGNAIAGGGAASKTIKVGGSEDVAATTSITATGNYHASPYGQYWTIQPSACSSCSVIVTPVLRAGP